MQFTLKFTSDNTKHMQIKHNFTKRNKSMQANSHMDNCEFTILLITIK